MIQEILQHGDVRLNQLSQPVESSKFGTVELDNLIENMLDTLRHVDGVGISAIQIGVPKRIALIMYDTTNTRYAHIGNCPLTVVINPELEPVGSIMLDRDEGCLSVRTKRGTTSRYTKLKYKFFNQHGKLIEGEDDSFFVRVLQHEVDHMNGILFLDRVVDKSTIRAI